MASGKERPPDEAWKCPAGLSRAEQRIEQDTAAGGSAARLFKRDDGTVVTVSVALRVPPGAYVIYAYLRWPDSGHKTKERYICPIKAPTRAESLTRAWSEARAKGFLPQVATTQE